MMLPACGSCLQLMPAMTKHRLGCLAGSAKNAATLDHRYVHMVWLQIIEGRAR